VTFLGKIRDCAARLLSIVLLPALLLLAAIFRPREKDIAVKPADFAALLRRVADDMVDRGEWGDFEGVPLRDKRLDDIRRKALPFCGRPGIVDEKALYALATEAEALPPLIE
jgi:hypothetical protein